MWDWAIWGALAFAVLVTGGAAIFLAVRAWRAWRSVRAVQRGVVGKLDELGAAGAATAEKAAAAGDTVELQESVARLRVSLTRLTVLRDALDEAGDTFGRVTAVVSRK